MISGASEQVVPRLRGLSHAVASVVSVAAAVVVVALAPAGRTTVALGLYGVGLVALFGGSAVYHRWPGPARFKPLLQRIDHSTIYVFIAATYTPLAVVLLHGRARLDDPGGRVGGRCGRRRVHARVDRSTVYGCRGQLPHARMDRCDRTSPARPRARTCPASPARRRRAALLRRGDRLRDTATRSLPRTFGFHEVFHALVIAVAAAQYAAIVGWVLPAS
jgi:hemolysin III